jgi:hypothetical protein
MRLVTRSISSSETVMISHFNLAIVRSVCVVGAMLASPLAIATEASTQSRAENLQVVDNLTMLGGQFRAAIDTDLGFPPEHVDQWQKSVDTAFARDRLEADFHAALETALSEQAREAALAYDRSQLGRDVLALVSTSGPLKEDPDHIAKTQNYLDTAPAEDKALLAELFAVQGGPDQTDAVMGQYFRAMIIAAEPVIGAEAAAQWIAGADGLRETYAAEHFLAHAAVFRLMPRAQLQELVAVLETPAMADYAAQTNAAFEEALQLAVERLDVGYARGLGNLRRAGEGESLR